MDELERWLISAGLCQLAPQLQANDIDLELLPELTEADFEKIGLSLGHRKKLLKMAAQLKSSPPSQPTPSPHPAREAPAERRQLTVLFVDLVESTLLASRLDPEDMSSVLRLFQNTVAAEVSRLDGYVAKWMGDGALVYFGWPRAYEDAAERAVRAAIAIMSSVGRLVTVSPTALAARAGIATGPVVVGEIIGEGGAREETAVGGTLSLAARLQALAPPGGILIAEGTRRLLGSLFDLEPLGAVELKGFELRLPAWRVRGGSRQQDRFEARAGPKLAPLIGRESEKALLLQRWTDACGGEGRALVIAGEAGIGKSRLVRGLRDAISGDPHAELHWSCSPFHADTPLWPVVRALIPDAEPPIAALERQFALSGVNAAEGVPLLAALLGVAPEPGYPRPEVSPEAERSRLLAILLEHCLGLAARRPLLVVVEDAHWADASTLELVRLLLDRMAASAVFLVIVSRPEGLPRLPSPSHLTRLTLGRLSRAAVAAIVAARVPDRMTTPLLEAVLSRTDGVPLFVEELSNALAERGSALVGADSTLEVPASLHDTLMARLDRLQRGKEVAQVAACIGREFDYPLLAALWDGAEAALSQGLEQLCEAELLFCRGTPPEATYRFKHALVRDAAYESLLKIRRRAIHARIVAAIERGVALAADEEMARHAAAAGLWIKALHYFGRAGKAALDRAANAEGFALTARALEAADHIDNDRHARVSVIGLHQARGWAYLTMGDTAGVKRELQQAEASAAQFGLDRLKCQLRAQRAHVETIFGGTIRDALRYARHAARIAARLEDSELSSVARFVLGLAFLFAGEYQAAAEVLSVDRAAYVHGLRITAVGSSGTLAVDGLAVFGDALGHLGCCEEALALGAEAKAVAAQTGNPWDMHVANYHLARTHLAHCDPTSALELIASNIDFGERCGLPMVVQWHYALLGQVNLQRGRYEEAIEWLDRAIIGCAPMKLRWTMSLALLAKAEALIAAGRLDMAERPAMEAFRLARRHGYKAFEAGARQALAACMRERDIAEFSAAH